MKRFTTIFLLVLTVQLTNAQTTFQKTFGTIGFDYARHMCQTSDSGVAILAGSMCMVRLDANYNLLWKKLHLSNNSVGLCIQQTSDGGFIIGGSKMNPGAGMTDAIYLKTDSTGTIQWSKVLSNPRYDCFFSILQTPDGSYIGGGYFDMFNGGWSGIYIVKIDANGDTLWTKAIKSGYTASGSSIKLSNDGGLIITGYTNSGLGSRVYLLKTDSLGNPLWAKTYGGSTIDEGANIQTTTDGGYIITGHTYFGAGNSDVYLIKTDSLGDILWTKTYGGTDHERGASVLQTNDGGYIITGFTTPIIGEFDIYVFKTDSAGDTLWTQTIIGVNSTSGDCNVFQTSDGGYVIMADTDINSPTHDILLIKIDSLGNSNCNTGHTQIIVTSPPTQVTTPLIITSSGGTIVQPSFTTSAPAFVTTTLCQSTSIYESNNTGESFNISPNPSNGNFIISFKGVLQTGSIEIYSLFGKIVFIGNISNVSQKEINFKNISSGIYIVKILEGDNRYFKKIIIEHD